MERKLEGNEVTYLHDSVNSVKVIRGQRGAYGYEIKVYGNNLDDAVSEIKRIESELNKTFGGDVK